MATDESDPSCPECGEPVGMHASYCMHCGAEFSSADDADFVNETADSGGLDVDNVGDAISDTLGGLDGASDRNDDVAAVDQESPSVDHESQSESDVATGHTGDATGEDASAQEQGLLHPDSLIDNSLTVVVGIVAGFIIGIVALIAFVVTVGAWGAVLALAAWIGSTAFLARRRTVFDAVEDGAYAMALLLLTVPFAAAIASTGGVSGRLQTFGVFLVPMGILAAIIAGIGYVAGMKGVE